MNNTHCASTERSSLYLVQKSHTVNGQDLQHTVLAITRYGQWRQTTKVQCNVYRPNYAVYTLMSVSVCCG